MDRHGRRSIVVFGADYKIENGQYAGDFPFPLLIHSGRAVIGSWFPHSDCVFLVKLPGNTLKDIYNILLFNVMCVH